MSIKEVVRMEIAIAFWACVICSTVWSTQFGVNPIAAFWCPAWMVAAAVLAVSRVIVAFMK